MGVGIVGKYGAGAWTNRFFIFAQTEMELARIFHQMNINTTDENSPTKENVRKNAKV